MKILFFDTETTGVPRNYNAPVTDTYNWPRLVQLGWIITNELGSVAKQRNYIVKPDGFIIPQEAASVHGITTERARREGRDLDSVLYEFVYDLNSVDRIVGHNIDFDKHIVGAEFYRLGMDYSKIFNLPYTCTMQSSINYCKLPPIRYGEYKWPKLEELHIKLFGRTFCGAHDAGADIAATKDCYFELNRIGVINDRLFGNFIRKIYSDGVYEGNFVDGKRTGKGKFTWSSSDVYEGDFLDCKRTGKGKFTRANGSVYEGDFVDGKRIGKGKFTWADGDVYEGDFVDNKRTGKGKYTWSSGNVYEGNFVDGKRTGKGKYTWPSGDVYEGDFVNGKITGKGKFTWSNGDVYEGDWVDGNRIGKGKLTWANGDVYEGDWVDGMSTGKGKLTWADGTVYEGDWVEDKRTGKGKMTLANGTVYEGNFVDDKFIG